ncbi:hypothetical protein, conserved [Plasmodium ovale curtisi]|uniref:Uncharacterized protein n=1 Tax=Plasmodium ovale curtisi TaxID=864141 RepID=A0A1A8WEC1_PLAOA|nr:hypothetical protein, conserved [Plasmodium ovale curtisi]SBT01624.1 hypothetical protein, conserved [Plasmodium ovale curtisi]
MNREKLEKQRLMQRNEKHVKNVVVDNVISDVKCQEGGNANDVYVRGGGVYAHVIYVCHTVKIYKHESRAYLRKTDAERENYLNREREKVKACMKIENRRKENLERNENRWKMTELNAQKENEKTKRLQSMPFKSEKNKSKCNHDIINHEYVNYDESMKLEGKKNISIIKRRNFLSEKTSGSYNPITAKRLKGNGCLRKEFIWLNGSTHTDRVRG